MADMTTTVGGSSRLRPYDTRRKKHKGIAYLRDYRDIFWEYRRDYILYHAKLQLDDSLLYDRPSRDDR